MIANNMNKILVFLSNQDIKEKLDKLNISLKLDFDIDYFEIDFNQEISEFQRDIISIDFEEKNYQYILNLSFLDYIQALKSFAYVSFGDFKAFCNVLSFLLPNIPTIVGIVENPLGKVFIDDLQEAKLFKYLSTTKGYEYQDNISILNTNSIYGINVHQNKESGCNEEYEAISIYDYLDCLLQAIKKNDIKDTFIYGKDSTLPELCFYKRNIHINYDMTEQDLIQEQNNQLKETNKEFLDGVTMYEIPLFSFSTCLLDQIEN